MNYYESLKKLNAQLFAFINYKKLNLPLKILSIIALLPFILVTIIYIGLYYLTLVVYYCIKSPIDHLQNLIRNEGKEVKHATQFIIYFIGFPFIFFANVILSIISCFFFIYNLFINIFGYLATLGGINYNPFLFNAKERNNEEIRHMAFIPSVVYIGVNLLLFVLLIVLGILYYVGGALIIFIISIIFSSIFLKFTIKEEKEVLPPLIEAEDYE
ncbi:MAG: hypothetical protein E7180_00030 [Erysipelotrichaceae bacterium]|nr:hypothetical protein [Erysipelotrichaceae bacterium]